MRETSEYLVEIEIDTGDLDSATVGGLRAAEAERARELFNRGSIISLWRVPGRWANLGLWSAPSESALMGLIDSLPLRPYMSVRVRSLEPHPSDPRQGFSDSQCSTAVVGTSHVLSPLPELRVQRRPERINANRSAEFELTPLPELLVRRRPAPQKVAQLGSVPEALVTVSASSPLPAQRSQNNAKPFTMWADADVTDFVKRGGGESPQRLRELIYSQTLETLAAYPEILGTTTGADGRLQVVRGQKEGHIHAATIVSLQGSPEAGSSTRANFATPVVTIADSGALGIGGYVASGDAAPLQLNSGPIVRTAVVRNLPGGDEGIQVRSVIRLVLTVTSQSASPESAGSFLASLIAKINEAAGSV